MKFTASSVLFFLVASAVASPMAAPEEAGSQEENPRVAQIQTKGLSLTSDVAGMGCGDWGYVY
jgi:hypothetical protein